MAKSPPRNHTSSKLSEDQKKQAAYSRKRTKWFEKTQGRKLQPGKKGRPA